MVTQALSLPELLSGLRAAWPAPNWEWDGRFRCALSTVEGTALARARAALAAALPAQFTAATLGGAPAAVGQVCAKTGGLRGDQDVFVASLADGTVVYCLWWPWGSRTDCSARVGATRAGADLTPDLKAAFALKG
jgi:hypothetical protein